MRCCKAVASAAADHEMAVALSVALRVPVLKIKRTSYSAGGEPMEWRENPIASSPEA